MGALNSGAVEVEKRARELKKGGGVSPPNARVLGCEEATYAATYAMGALQAAPHCPPHIANRTRPPDDHGTRLYHKMGWHTRCAPRRIGQTIALGPGLHRRSSGRCHRMNR